MELYRFFWGLLAWTATLMVLFPANVPLLWLAYRIQRGARPLSETESEELWTRCFIGAFVLAAATAGFVVLDYLVADWLDFPPGPIHLFIFVAYVPAGMWILFWAFAYDDFLEGLSAFVIYLSLPLVALYLLNSVTGVWEGPVNYAKTWLKSPG